jgi:hypothetical protein
MSHIGQGTHDAIITPAWILARQLEHQLFNRDRDRGSSRSGFASAGEIPFAGGQAAMPFEQGLGLHNRDEVV